MIGTEIRTGPVVIGRLNERAEHAIIDSESTIAETDRDPERFRAPLEDVDRLREDTIGYEEPRLPRRRLPGVDAMEHRHRLGGGRASSSSEAVAISMPVRSRTIVWKLRSDFEAALRDLGLIRRVRRIPAGIFEHVAENHRRGHAVVVTRFR